MLANLPAGYCVSPNNINNLPGVEIYAAGPGVAEPADWLTEGVINLREDGRILVGGRKASPGKLEFVVSREFANAAEFLAYYATAGKISEPGAPCGYRNVWD